MSIKVEDGSITVDGDDLKDLQDKARRHLEEMRPPEGTPAVSEVETGYAVLCPEHGKTFLTDDEYGRQLCRPDSRWTCPRCGRISQWDDDHYEKWLDGQGGPDEGPDVHDERCAETCACKFWPSFAKGLVES